MKVLVVFAIIVACASAITMDDIKAKMGAQLQSCAEEVHASPDDVANFVSHTLPSSHEGKCLYFCMHHRLFNLQSESGTFTFDDALAKLEVMKEVVPDMYPKLIEMHQACTTVAVDSDPCITAYNFAECAIAASKKLGLDKMMM